MTTLASKVALVTGSARGIGRAIAERYEQLGASVVVNYSERHREGDVLSACTACGRALLPGSKTKRQRRPAPCIDVRVSLTDERG